MKRERGITLVSLVVTIIILIILAGISLNMVIGKNGLITKAQEAKENTLLAQEEEAKGLNQLYSQLNNIEGSAGGEGDIENGEIEKLLEFKKAIATAITKEGVETQETDSAETMASNIGKILQERTKDATATAEDIAEGKTAWVNGSKLTGERKSLGKDKIKVGELANDYPYDYYKESIDVKPIIENYKNITIDNFVYQVTRVTGYMWTTEAVYGADTYAIPELLYNNETGILTLKYTIKDGQTGLATGIRMDVYYIP